MKPLSAGLHRGLTMARYLGQCAPGPVVQATDLKRLIDRCPLWAWTRYSGNPNCIEESDTEATRFGSAAHCLLLEGPRKFADEWIVKPEGREGDGRTKEGKAWAEAHAQWIEAGTVISADEYAAILEMDAAIRAHPWASRAMAEGEPEVTAIVQDPETQLWLKVRPDWLTPRLALNLKTTTHNGAAKFCEQSWRLKYHLGAALTEDVLKMLGEPRTVALLPIEKSQPFIPVLRALPERHMVVGRLLYRKALRQFADCLNTGKWPGYADDGVDQMESLSWQEREIDRLIETDIAEQKEAA